MADKKKVYPNKRPRDRKPRHQLTAKQLRFWNRYMETQNAADAYRWAYSSQASPQICSQEGQRLLKHPLIAPLYAKIQEVRRPVAQEEARKFELTKDRVSLELARMAYINFADLVEDLPDGSVRFRKLSELSRHETAAIKKMTIETTIRGTGDNVSTTQRIGIELYDKRAPLQMLGQEIGMFKHSDPEPPPPPPPVPADQQPATFTEDQRAAARQRVFRLLDSLAKPEPLEPDDTPQTMPNGRANGHSNGHAGG